VDRGIRKKALLGLGKVDVAYPDMIFRETRALRSWAPAATNMTRYNGSGEGYKVGDIVEFDLCYATLCFVTNSPMSASCALKAAYLSNFIRLGGINAGVTPRNYEK
jgi:hypothetical protein